MRLRILILVFAIFQEITCSNHECDRTCDASAAPMECYYEFTLQWYHTMTAPCGKCITGNVSECFTEGCIFGDGRPKPIMTVNKMLPGPTIRVCHNDIIKVKVVNKLTGGESVSIHWHGIYQTDTPFMDGTSMITQCPIIRGTSFTYKFKADPPGTHFWHAHTGVHRGEGIAGPLIVTEDSSKDISSGTFHRDMNEHVIMFGDWSTKRGNDRVTYTNLGGPLFFSDSIIVNGIGYTEISIDNHLITVIATDGSAVEPHTVSNLYVRSGERFDIVVHANQEAANYWFRINAVQECMFSHNAILNYEGVSDSETPVTSVWDEVHVGYNVLNKHNVNTGFITELAPKYSDDYPKNPRLKDEPDAVHFMWGDIVNHNRVEMNGVENAVPSSPLLGQPEETPVTCNPESPSFNHSEFCEGDYCSCVHLIDVELDSMVDIVVFDRSQEMVYAGHDFHLHGHQFHVLHIEQLTVGTPLKMDQIKKLYNESKHMFNTENPVMKDTVGVPSYGYAVLRFIANKPGVWLFHCHYGLHSNLGMGLSFRVGYPDHFPSPPYKFPTCGSWEEEEPPPNTTPTPPTTTSDAKKNFINCHILAMWMVLLSATIKCF